MNPSQSERRNADDAWRRAHFQLVSAILYRADPIGLIRRQTGDEYDSEAREIIKALDRQTESTHIESLVHAVFVRRHGLAAGSEREYNGIAKEIFLLLKKYEGGLSAEDRGHTGA